MRLHLDFETRSEADLERVGAIAYAQHPSTHVMCMGYAFDDDPVVVLTGKQVRAGAFLPALRDDITVVSHNAPFEDAIWEYVMHRKYGYAPIREPHRWDCTMARALMVGLPAPLEQVAKVLGLSFQKDLDGRRATLLLSKPAGRDALGDIIWNNDPTLVAKMLAYNPLDVEVERAADKVLPQMLPHERAVWEHTLVTNRRGVAVDLDLARKASRLAGVLTDDLNSALRRLTNGFVDKATQVARMKAWLVTQGLTEYAPKTAPSSEGADEEEAESLDKAAMLALLDRKDLSPLVREVLSVRQQVGKSSTAKYIKTLETACADGRVRGVLQYHAAHTGRDGGRLIQPQNYPKGFMDPKAQAAAIDAIMADDAGMFDIMYGVRGMEVLSDTLRGTIVAGPGKKLVSADYSSIELCVEMWLAGDEATLNLLRKGGKPYVEMAQAIYNNPSVKKDTHPKEYDLGKRAVLGCFEPDTLVLTSNGWKPIISVDGRDRLWDGTEWVTHDGVIDQGVKDTIRFAGIGVTPDHLFETPEGWVSASQVVRGGIDFLRSMTATVASGLLASRWVPGEECSESGCVAVVDVSRPSASIISDGARRLAAMRVRSGLPPRHANATGATLLSARKTLIENDYSTGLRPQSSGARTPATTTIGTTERVASAYGRHGAKTENFFSRICSRLKAGTTPLWNSIASRTVPATTRAISVSRRAGKITRIAGTWATFKGRFFVSEGGSRVYDVLNAGPRNKFTILTVLGPVVVHNCGYGMGAAKFKTTCKIQANLDIDDELAQRAVSVYRQKYPLVVELWKGVEAAAIGAVKNPGTSYACCRGKVLWVMSKDRRFLVAKLPSGRFLWYWKPTVVNARTPWGEMKESIQYFGKHPVNKQWVALKTYGGLFTENLTQAVARDIMMHGALAVEKCGFEMVLRVHDELLAEIETEYVGEYNGKEELDRFLKIMCETPAWAEGCPVSAEGWIGDRYRK